MLNSLIYAARYGFGRKMLTIDAVHCKTYLHEQQPKELEKLPHTLTYLDIEAFPLTEQEPQIPDKIWKLNYSFARLARQSKASTTYDLNLYDFERIFQTTGEMIDILKPEAEEQQEEPEPEPVYEIVSDKKKKGKKGYQEATPPPPPPPVERTPEPEIEQLPLKQIVYCWKNLAVAFLRDYMDVELKKVNFVGLTQTCRQIVSEVFSEYDPRFYDYAEAILATFVFENACFRGERIAVFSYRNDYPCYYVLTIDLSRWRAGAALPFVEAYPHCYFDPKLRKEQKRLVNIDENGLFVYSQGYRPLRFRESIKQQFRAQLARLIRKMDCYYVVCDDSFSNAFEQYREPSKERVAYDLRTICAQWNYGLKYKLFTDFKASVFPVLRRVELLEAYPALIKEITLKRLFKQYFDEERTAEAIYRLELLREVPADPFTVILTVKVKQETGLDAYLLSLFDFVDRIAIEYDTEVNIQIGASLPFLQAIRTELADEFVEEEEEHEAEEVQPEKDEDEEQVQGEEQLEGAEEAYSGNDDLAEKAAEIDNTQGYDQLPAGETEQAQEDAIGEPPQPPKSVNKLRALHKDLNANSQAFGLKTFGGKRVKYAQYELFCLVSGVRKAACQIIAARIAYYLKNSGSIYSEVSSHGQVTLDKTCIFGVDLLQAGPGQSAEYGDCIQLHYCQNSRYLAGTYLVFYAESCKQFGEIATYFKKNRQLGADSVVLTAGYFRLISREIAQLLRQEEEPADEFDEVEDAQEPEEAEEEPEEEKFANEEAEEEQEKTPESQGKAGDE